MPEFKEIIGFDQWIIIFTFCNLLILCFILKVILFKPVKKMIEDRQNEVDNMYKTAQEAQDKAVALKSEFDKKILQAKDISAGIVKDATRNATIKSEEIIKNANESASLIITKANSEAKRQSEQILNDSKREIGTMAVMLAGKIIKKNIDENSNEQLVDDFINQLK